MNGTLDLKDILVNMNPVLKEEEYVFCSFPGLSSEAPHHLNPISTFQEDEGLSLIITRNVADINGISYDSVFKRITIQLHTSLDAVGLTSLLSTALAGKGISANVVAAYYHDHIFVPSEKAEVALETIKALKC